MFEGGGRGKGVGRRVREIYRGVRDCRGKEKKVGIEEVEIGQLFAWMGGGTYTVAYVAVVCLEVSPGNSENI